VPCMSPLALALALVCMSAGAANSGSGDLDSGGSKTDITGLRLEDVVEDMRGALGKSAHSLRVSNVPLQEVVKIQTELHQNMNKKVPEDRRWVESGNLASFNGMSPEPYLTVPSASPCPYPCPQPAPPPPAAKFLSFFQNSGSTHPCHLIPAVDPLNPLGDWRRRHAVTTRIRPVCNPGGKR